MERLRPEDVDLCESFVFLNVIRSQVSMEHGDMLECDVANADLLFFLPVHDLDHQAVCALQDNSLVLASLLPGSPWSQIAFEIQFDGSMSIS